MYLLFLILFFKTFAGMLFINKYLSILFSYNISKKILAFVTESPGSCHGSHLTPHESAATPRIFSAANCLVVCFRRSSERSTMRVSKTYGSAGWWFQVFFDFHPDIWGNNPI